MIWLLTCTAVCILCWFFLDIWTSEFPFVVVQALIVLLKFAVLQISGLLHRPNAPLQPCPVYQFHILSPRSCMLSIRPAWMADTVRHTWTKTVVSFVTVYVYQNVSVHFCENGVRKRRFRMCNWMAIGYALWLANDRALCVFSNQHVFDAADVSAEFLSGKVLFLANYVYIYSRAMIFSLMICSYSPYELCPSGYLKPKVGAQESHAVFFAIANDWCIHALSLSLSKTAIDHYAVAPPF